MKILKWMHKKLNWSSEKKKKKPNSFSATYKSSVTEPHAHGHALLLIGTFGNLKENSSSQDSVLEFTLQNLQNELNMYFQELVESNCVKEHKENTMDQINQHLNGEHSGLEVEGKENETFSDGSNSKGGNFYPNSSHTSDNRKRVNGKKTLAFLLKKMFVCRSGFQPTPSFKDLLPLESRMEKILRAMLQKMLCAQRSSSAIVIKKYLPNKHVPKSDNDKEELTTDEDDGRKWDTWDRTDSQYIVLEI